MKKTFSFPRNSYICFNTRQCLCYSISARSGFATKATKMSSALDANDLISTHARTELQLFPFRMFITESCDLENRINHPAAVNINRAVLYRQRAKQRQVYGNNLFGCLNVRNWTSPVITCQSATLECHYFILFYFVVTSH